MTRWIGAIGLAISDELLRLPMRGLLILRGVGHAGCSGAITSSERALVRRGPVSQKCGAGGGMRLCGMAARFGLPFACKRMDLTHSPGTTDNLAIHNLEHPVRTVAIFEAKNRLSELLSAVEHGEEITITRHGRPVARLVSAHTPSQGAQSQRERVSSTMARLRTLRQGTTLGAPLSEAIADGRD